MKPIVRRLVAGLSLPALAGALLAAGVTSAAPAGAAPLPVGASMSTSVTISGDDVLTIAATGTTWGQLTPNVAVMLQVDGVESYVNPFGASEAAPIRSSSETVVQRDTWTTTYTAYLHPRSTLALSYTAEAAGAAPPVANGCAGAIARDQEFHAGSPQIVKTC